MAKPETKRSRRGCAACRARHLKCDETSPVCQRCRENGRECEQAPLISQWRKPKKMRKASSPPSKSSGQSWVHIPSKRKVPPFADASDVLLTIPAVTFVVDSVVDDTYSQLHPPPQEAQDIQTLGDSEPSPLSSADDSSLSQFAASVAFSADPMDWPTITTPFLDLQSLDCLASLDGSTYLPDAFSDQEMRDMCQNADNSVYLIADKTASQDADMSSNMENDQASTSSRRDSASLINDRTEAHLLRHYRQTLAPLLEVTKRASECQLLLNAIFALSALHLSLTCSFDASVAVKYYARCTSMLDSVLKKEQSVQDDNVLATMVIIRKYEEMNGHDCEQHMAKSAALFNSPACALGSGLGQTAFWQFIRQDIYLSLPKRKPPRTNISIQPPLTKDMGPPDCVWANRIVWITVSVLAYCFAEEPQDTMVWHDLNQKILQWDREKPPTFDPVYFREPSRQEGRFFPEIWLSDPWHGECLILIPNRADLLLALFNPNVARVSAGLDYAKAHWQMRKSVLYHARYACGIVSSNDFVTTRFTLCAIMLSCGGWFTDSAEQAAITGLLSAAERENGWPTKPWGRKDTAVSIGRAPASEICIGTSGLRRAKTHFEYPLASLQSVLGKPEPEAPSLSSPSMTKMIPVVHGLAFAASIAPSHALGVAPP
ncbi:hypothetical protein F66182_1306 [Fusarium sp. NRRL 66182]|nr:hypothetical protein F66182_1306 [Fusarium sp. NRRL 66182]